MEKVVESLKEHGTPESDPKMEGKLLIAIFTPGTATAKKTSAPAKPAMGNTVISKPASPQADTPPAKKGPIVETTGPSKTGSTTKRV